jgi:hypothetical protein
MSAEERAATAHHEAGHAVISFVLGVKFMFIVMWDDKNGVVVPECGSCETCDGFFEKNDPRAEPSSDDRANARLADHARTIRDDLRRRVAISLAGEIAEKIFTGSAEAIDPKEVECDRRKTRESARFLHCWSGTCPGLEQWDAPCTICDPFLADMSTSVDRLLRDSSTRKAFSALATHLIAAAVEPIEWWVATKLLEESGLRFGSVAVASLPMLP